MLPFSFYFLLFVFCFSFSQQSMTFSPRKIQQTVQKHTNTIDVLLMYYLHMHKSFSCKQVNKCYFEILLRKMRVKVRSKRRFLNNMFCTDFVRLCLFPIRVPYFIIFKFAGFSVFKWRQNQKAWLKPLFRARKRPAQNQVWAHWSQMSAQSSPLRAASTAAPYLSRPGSLELKQIKNYGQFFLPTIQAVYFVIFLSVENISLIDLFPPYLGLSPLINYLFSQVTPFAKSACKFLVLIF